MKYKSTVVRNWDIVQAGERRTTVTTPPVALVINEPTSLETTSNRDETSPPDGGSVSDIEEGSRFGPEGTDK